LGKRKEEQEIGSKNSDLKESEEQKMASDWTNISAGV
jgi:hypothetical protein